MTSDFLVDQDIPVEEKANYYVKDNNGYYVESYEKFLIVRFEWRKKHAIDNVTFLAIKVLTMLGRPEESVCTWEDNDSQKSDWHHFDESVVKAKRLVDFVDIFLGTLSET